MITVKRFEDEDIKLSVRIDKYDDHFEVVCYCEKLNEEQAKNFFDFIVRPFFYDLHQCGLKPSYINKDLYKDDSD